MATCTTDGVLFIGGVQWSSSRTTFHGNKGENVELTEKKSVANRTKHSGNAIVFTSEPMVAGQMLKVIVTGREDRWRGVGKRRCPSRRGGGGMVRAYRVYIYIDCLLSHNYQQSTVYLRIILLCGLSLTGYWFHWREPDELNTDTVNEFEMEKCAQAFTVYSRHFSLV